MKKVFYCIVLLQLFLCISGCSVKSADEEVIQAGKDAIMLADDFLDGKSDPATISNKIDNISESLAYMDFSDVGNPNCDIDIKITELSVKLDSLPESGIDEGGSVLNARNRLAELVGIEKRKYKEYDVLQQYESQEEST